jgi:DinB superfamily
MRETPEQYRERVLRLVGEKDALKLLATAPAQLAKLLNGLPPAKARKRPAPDKWSIAEIVVHLADTEVVWSYRIRTIVGEPGGVQFGGFDQDAWLTALHYDKRNMKKSFEEYRAFRESNVALLKSLTPGQWQICGTHQVRGQESIETSVKMFAGHDINHFGQIERILSMKRK